MSIKSATKSFMYEKIIPWLGYILIHCLFITIRTKWLHADFTHSRRKKGQPVIYAFWHNRLLYMGFAYKYILNSYEPKRKLVAMVSRSKDGRIIGKILELFNIHPAYGSSSRGGTEALRELIKVINEQHFDCGITPDGPRGPKYSVQPGIISIAQATGVPIVPVAYDARRKARLRSWDGFYIPFPFTRAVMYFGEPIFVESSITEEQREQLQKLLKKRLAEVCLRANQYLSE